MHRIVTGVMIGFVSGWVLRGLRLRRNQEMVHGHKHRGEHNECNECAFVVGDDEYLDITPTEERYRAWGRDLEEQVLNLHEEIRRRDGSA